ncbi:MFS transporter [Blastococcus litoris]|uniref:MFS transporter n=1 Tax=Blastococcus litoris TaxID=2171622 RepID=UPI0013E0B041|nr:MFS transporter [Blastococcus litoris]
MAQLTTRSRYEGARLVTGGVLLDTAGILPVGLVGALAAPIGESLALTSGRLAVVVTGFFLTGSVTAMLLGSRIDRAGPRRAAGAAGIVTVAAVLAVAVLARHWVVLLASICVCGAAFSITMPATNALLRARIPEARLATVVSIKQCAVPVALLLAGTAVATVEDWRWAFVAVVAVPLAGWSLLPRFPVPRGDADPGSGRSARRGVLSVGVSVGLASLLPGALTGFAVLTLTDGGLAAPVAGAVVIAANVLGIVVRLGAGVWADRKGSDGYRPVAVLMAAGAVGAVLLGTGPVPLLIAGALLAYGFGWGWSGLTYFLVVRGPAEHAGSTSSVIQAGGMAGSASGPLAMGLLLQATDHTGAWWCVAAFTAVAALVVARAASARRADQPRASV